MKVPDQVDRMWVGFFDTDTLYWNFVSYGLKFGFEIDQNQKNSNIDVKRRKYWRRTLKSLAERDPPWIFSFFSWFDDG